MSIFCRLRCLMLFLFLVTASTLFAEDFSLWLKHMPITFPGVAEDVTLTNFPVLIILEETDAGFGFSYTDFRSPPYNDLRFTAEDKQTPLDFEVESWNSDGKSCVWVKIPELTQDTKIHAFWGKEEVSLPASTSDGSVWCENFLGVWHMNDATVTNITDSTAHGYHGRKKDEGSPLEVDAVIGQGQKFDDSYVDLTGMTDDTQIYTISMWAYGDISGNYYLIDVETGRIFVTWGHSNKIAIYDTTWRYFGSELLVETWHHLVFLCEEKHVSMYLNGQKYGSTQTYTQRGIGGTVVLGSRNIKTDYYFPGMIDEVRISTTIRSPDWILACYQNQKPDSDFVGYGNPETYMFPYITNSSGATNVTITSAWLNGNLVSTGAMETAVLLYWGESNGADDPDEWDSSTNWPAPQLPGLFSFYLSGLDVDTYYYYRYMAESDLGRSWANKASAFVTSEVWFEEVADAQFLSLIQGEVIIRRKEEVNSEPLDVYYSIGGTATPGLEYVELPGVVTIPAGETSATITIEPMSALTMTATKTVKLEIMAGAIKGNPATAEIKILVDDMSSWQKAMPITFPTYTNRIPLINFPAMIILQPTDSGAGFSYDDFLAPPYNDLRFAADDKLTPLDFEVELWDTSGKSYVWVKIPELTEGTTVYALWGKENVCLPPCNTNGAVWIENFLGVWHMNDATEDSIIDSTIHGFNGTKLAVGSPLEVGGVIGKGQLFNESYIDLTGMTDGAQIYTISMWANCSKNGSGLYPLDVENGRLLIGWGTDQANQVGLWDGSWRYFGSSLSVNTWHYMVFLCERTTVSMYHNALKYGVTRPFSPRNIAGQVTIGARFSMDGYYFPGMLDEIRISTTIRSPDWIWACYQNQGNNESFNEYGEILSLITHGTIYSFW